LSEDIFAGFNTVSVRNVWSFLLWFSSAWVFSLTREGGRKTNDNSTRFLSPIKNSCLSFSTNCSCTSSFLCVVHVWKEVVFHLVSSVFCYARQNLGVAWRSHHHAWIYPSRQRSWCGSTTTV
jgi:hypothetical protein